MTDLDLTEAEQVARTALLRPEYPLDQATTSLGKLNPQRMNALAEECAEVAVAAAAPFIAEEVERRVRETIADEERKRIARELDNNGHWKAAAFVRRGGAA